MPLTSPENAASGVSSAPVTPTSGEPRNSRKKSFFFAMLGLLVFYFSFSAAPHRKTQPTYVPVKQVKAVKAVSQKAAGKSARSWFAAIRPSCNAVEVEAHIQDRPAPSDNVGAAYTATCLILAGKPDRAREVINELQQDKRMDAALVVFNTIHPIADRGGDMATLPGMLVILDYMPDNYQALYHAGIAEAKLGKFKDADEHLTKFLNLYTRSDHFTRRGREVLEKVRAHRRDVDLIERRRQRDQAAQDQAK